MKKCETAERIPEAQAEAEKNVKLLKSHGIFTTEEELKARAVIGVSKYTNIVNIEARTMILMTEKDIMPAVIKYGSELAYGIESKQALGLNVDHEMELLTDINEHIRALNANNVKLQEALKEQPAGTFEAGMHAFERILPAMEEERRIVDELELMVDKQSWPYPDYTDLLYYV